MPIQLIADAVTQNVPSSPARGATGTPIWKVVIGRLLRLTIEKAALLRLVRVP
jgi:hypothetical protein